MSSAVETAPFQLPDRPREADVLAKYFRAIGEPTRLRILELLGDGERSVGDLVAALETPQPQVSNHLACLRWCRFVETRRDGRTIYYRIADPRVPALIELARELLAGNEELVAACGIAR